MRNIQHFHVFHNRIAGERHPFATVAVGLDESNRTHIAVAVCSSKENFSRRTGAAIARGRLLANQTEVVNADYTPIIALTDIMSRVKRNDNIRYADFTTAFNTMISVVNDVNGAKSIKKLLTSPNA